jgi:DNA-binding NarL/FixJ family response regulator
MKTVKNPNIKTVIIERRRDLREDLISFVNSTPGLFCIGAYPTLKNALADFGRQTPDIVLWNQNAKRTNEVRILREKFPNLPVLILNIYDENIFDEPNVEATACLLKVSLPAKLLKSVRRFLTGNAPDSSEIIARVIGLFGVFSAPEHINYELTPHERRLLELLVEGHNYTSAAKVLRVSYNTVKFHMRRIFQKLEVNSKSAAVIKAMRHRLIN